MAIEILTGALVVITGFYAWATFRIMKANERTVAGMRQQVEALTRPYISIGLVTVPNSHLFYLRIANTGKTGAKNVRLSLDRDFFQYGQPSGPNLRNVSAFQDPISELPPAAEIVFGLAMGAQLVGSQLNPALTPPLFSVTAAYAFSDKAVTEVTTIDTRPYRDSMRPPSAVVAELHGMKEQLEKIANKR